MQDVTPCPNCHGTTLYESGELSAHTGQHGENLLPGLGSFCRFARFTIVVCRDCGLMRFFASRQATAKLKESRKWRPVTPTDRGGLR